MVTIPKNRENYLGFKLTLFCLSTKVKSAILVKFINIKLKVRKHLHHHISSLRGGCFRLTKLVYNYPNHFYWNACSKPGKRAVMYLCVRAIDFGLRFWFETTKFSAQRKAYITRGIINKYENDEIKKVNEDLISRQSTKVSDTMVFVCPP